MRTLFICWRTYQIMNSINFVYNNLEGTKCISDIIVLNDFYGSEEVANRLKKLNIFDKVIYAKMEGKRSLFKKVINSLFPRQYVRKKFGADFDFNYNQIVAAGWNYLVYKFDELLNHKEKFICLEDGVASYWGDNRKIEFKRLRYKILDKIFRKGPFSVKINCLYVSYPSICNSQGIDNVLKLPQIDINNFDLLNQFKYVFNFNISENYYNCDFVFCDQLIDNEFGPHTQISRLEVLNIIANTVGKNNMLLRKHPNDQTNYDENQFGYIVDIERNMWELLCLYQIEDTKTLISFHSAALTIPKLLFNKEPKIICLYELMDQNDIVKYNQINDYFNKFKKIYSDESKIMIPKTIKELKENLVRIKNSYHKCNKDHHE